MSRITKQIAEEVAKAMTAEKAKNVTDLKDRFKQSVEEIALLRVPETVTKLFKDSSLRAYISQSDYVYLHSHGFNFRGVRLKNPVPVNKGQNSLELTALEGKFLWNLEKEYKKAEEGLEELTQEIYFTLLHTLKTYKKVQDHFPEAFEHLPKVGTPTSLAINLDALRHKIQKS